MNIESFIRRFKNTFSLVMELNNDTREFQLIPWNSGKGYFSAFNNPDDHYTFSCKYDLSKIEIYYKIPVIENSYFNVDLNLNEEEHNIISTYLATHEYGHTYFCDSTYTLKILFEQDITLPNGFNFIFLVSLFSEYSAEFHARLIFPKNPDPLTSLFINNPRFREMLNAFYLYQFPWSDPPDDQRLYDSYQYEFTELIRMFVFNKWEILMPLFSIFRIEMFLNFCKRLFTVFRDMMIKTNRPPLLREYLINLAEILDNIRFKDLILGTIDKNNLNKLRLLELDPFQS